MKKSIYLCICVLIALVGSNCSKNEIEPTISQNPSQVQMSALAVANAVYIDPQYTGTKTGSIDQPFNSWNDLVWKDGYTYLFKCGSVINANVNLRPNANNITIGSYGTGNRPHFISSVSGGKVFDLGSLKNVIIRDIEVESSNNALTCFHFMSSVGGTLINCKIHGSEWGVRNVNTTGNLRIINCEIYMTGDDGCFNMNTDSVELAGSYIHDVNQKYFVNQAESYSGGDVFQLENVKYFNIHDNTLDHSRTGNKFCFISNCSDGVTVSHGIIEKNHLLRDNSGILLYLEYAENVLIRYNRFENAEIALYSHSINPQLYYNEFINITGNAFMLGSTGTGTKMLNNTFINVKTLLNSNTEVVTFNNDIFSNCSGTLFVGGSNIKLDYNCYNQVSNIGVTAGAHSIQADPMFNDPSNKDYCLKSGSPCIDKGSLWSQYSDYAGISVPTGSSVDIGSHEYSSVVPSGNKLPVVSISTPINGQSFTAPATLVISANASDADGTISKVEFFNGTTKLGESTTAPYSFNWTNVAAGTYSLTAVATDNSNAKTTSAAVTAYVSTSTSTNKPPIVSITSPSNGQNFNAPATCTITANASDADGTISKVEFFSGTTKLGESPSSPYSLTWSNVSDGSYQITAVATDNLGAKTTSSIVYIYVNNVATTTNKPPVASITAPVTGTSFTAPALIPITASATDPDGTVSKVEFFNGTTKIGESTTYPYSFNWSNVAAGTYSLTIVATDNLNLKTTSSAVTVVVNNQVSSGAIFYRNGSFSGASITLSPGSYTAVQMGNMGMPDNNISSIKVNGYKVIAYMNDNFTGAQYTFTSDASSLSGIGWNDQISSIKVQ